MIYKPKFAHKFAILYTRTKHTGYIRDGKERIEIELDSNTVQGLLAFFFSWWHEKHRSGLMGPTCEDVNHWALRLEPTNEMSVLNLKER